MTHRSTRFPGQEYVFLGDVEFSRLRPIFEDAVKRFGSRSEILDCERSLTRRGCDLTSDQVLDLAVAERSLWTMVHRVGYGRDQWELCASTFSSPSHFLYIFAESEAGRQFAKDHGLSIIPAMS
jgi:hypothetical protein